MAIEKVVNIIVNQKGTEKAQAQIEKLSTSLKKVKDNTGEVAKGFKDSSNSILENGGAMGLLNDLTGGYAMTVKDAVEASGLFTKGTTIATTAQKLYALVVGSTTGALKALRLALVSTGLGAVVVLLGVFISKINESSEATEEQTLQQEALNETLKRTSDLYQQNIKDLEDVTKERILQAKIAGASETDLRKIEKEVADQRYKEYKAERDRLFGLLSDKKTTAEQAKIINDKLSANQKEYFNRLNEDKLKDLEGELSVVEAKRQANKDALEKRKEDEKKSAEERQKQREEEEEKRKKFEDSVKQGQNDLQLATNEAEFEQGQLKIEEAERVSKELQRIAEEQTKKEKEEADKQIAIDKLREEVISDTKVRLRTNTENLISAIAKKGSAVAKALAITGIVREQIQSATSSISNLTIANAKAAAASPLTAGQPFVAINTASTIAGIAASAIGAGKAIKDILSESKSAGGAGGGSGAGGGANTPTPPSFNLVQGTASNQIAEGLANERRPLQAYVVSGSVSTAAALERNIVNDARL